ncbi:hypothetical protein P7C73_g987, partial [Tremellales sp. Uapishka_1]
MDDNLDAKWECLCQWLEDKHVGFRTEVVWKDAAGAGRGLFATRSMDVFQPLLEIPSSALLNPLTLLKSPSNTIPSQLFPVPDRKLGSKSTKRAKKTPRLNTTQLLTLHLALTRDPGGGHPSDWQPYLRTLPQTFTPWHPLSWSVDQDDTWWKALLGEGVSRGVREKIDDVKERFEEDAAVLRLVLREEEPFKGQALDSRITPSDLLWAWLNVNTRTVSLPLNLPAPTHLYNHTLVPILDFANHSSDPKVTIPAPVTFSSSSLSTPSTICFRLHSPEQGMNTDQEVLFQYGAHSNGMLLAEYGFCERQNAHSEVDVGYLIDETDFEIKKKEALKAIGCWRKNTIHPDNPSHSLLMTLRVKHLSTPSKLASISKGLTTYISPDNEEKVKESLRSICETVITDAEAGIKWLEDLLLDEVDKNRLDTARMLKGLREEEKAIAVGIMRRIQDGASFE